MHPLPSRVLLPAVLLVALAVPGLPASGETGSPASTAISDVAPLRLASGMTAGASFTVTHEAHGPVEPGALLPAARIDRAEHPDAMAGLWAEAGSSASWLAPTGTWQFATTASFVESVHVDGALHEDGPALSAGDRAEIAMVANAANATVPWNVARGEPTGELEWDAAWEIKTVEATYGGVTHSMDVVLLRADIVARGGDVDARGEGMTTGWLEIDLPRVYPELPATFGLLGVESPFTRYVRGVELVRLPELGKLLLRADVQGWFPEAREDSLAGRTDAGHWHVPIRGTLAVDPGRPLYGLVDPPVTPQAQLSLVTGGEVHLFDDSPTPERLTVEPGGMVRAGLGVPAEVLGSGGEAAEGGAAPIWDEEAETAAGIDHRLAEPVTVSAADGRYSLTVDPDLFGAGLLGLRGVTHTGTAATYADVLTVPGAVVDGQPVLLDRSRLVELRVVPVRVHPMRARARSSNSSTPVASGGAIVADGFVLHAVYELGADRYLKVHVKTPDALSFGAPVLTPGEVVVEAEAWSLDRRPIAVRPLTTVTVPAAGSATDGVETWTTEFAEQISPARWLTVGDAHRLRSGWSGAGRGTTTVLTGATAPFASPESSQPLSEAQTTVAYLPPAGASPAPLVRSVVQVTVDAAPPEPVADPPPLGTSCGDPQVAGGPLNPTIRAGWLADDDAALYATMEVSLIPDAAPPGTTLDWAFYLGHTHNTGSAFATLNAAGDWSFRASGQPTTGEVDRDQGLIRVAFPRGLLRVRDGELVRDTSVFWWLSHFGGRERLESAPLGSTWESGTGGDYRVGSCRG